MQGQFTLPLLAFQHHVGQLYIDPAEIQWVRELGNSDLAIVEQGRWRRADGSTTNIVCKVWRPFVVATPQDFRELLLEASKLHRLQHPHITRFMGLGCFAHGSLAEVRESMFMVEEYVGQRTLRKLVSEQMRIRHRNLYDARTAVHWASQLACALVALHEQQPPYVHNDVKADNVFLTDTPRLAAAVAKLGDLKPHRHVYDREPSTLSRHHQQQQQQQRLLARPPHPSSLPAPKYTLERCSGSSACSEDARASWGSNCSSMVGPPPAGATAAAASSQQQEPPPLLPQQQQQSVVMLSSCFAATSEYSSSSWSAAQDTGLDLSTPAAPPAPEAPAAAPVAAAASGGSPCTVACVRSLPVPITARSSHSSRGGSCPADWNPGLADSATPAAAAGPAGHAGAAATAAVDMGDGDDGVSIGPPTFHSVNSHSMGSFGSTAFSPLHSGSSASCRSTFLPLQGQHSLAAEVAAADAAAEAAAAAAAAGADASAAGRVVAPAAAAEVEAAEQSQQEAPAWMAVGRQGSGNTWEAYLSDSASSTGGTRGSGTKAAALLGSSLAADLEAEDPCGVPSAAGAAGLSVVSKDPAAAAVVAKQLPGDGAVKATKHNSSKSKQQQQQQPKRSSSGLFRGALATAFANAKQAPPVLESKPLRETNKQQQELASGAEAIMQQHQVSHKQQHNSSAAVSQESPWQNQQQQQQAVWALQEQQQQQQYRRCKSSPLDSQQRPLQLTSSAPDVVLQRSGSSDVEEAVHRGSLMMMPLHLSEPTGLCSLHALSSSCNGGAAAADAAPAGRAGTTAEAASAGGAREGRAHGGNARLPATIAEGAVAPATATAAAAAAGGSVEQPQLQLQEQQQQQAKPAAPEKAPLRHAHSQPQPPHGSGNGLSSSGISNGVGGSSSSGCVYYGWELLPSGAASPCGAVQSSLLDLFADMSEDDISSRRWRRDACQYTLVPGSFVQHKAPLSGSASAPVQRSKSASAAWDASAVAASAAAAAAAEPSAASCTVGSSSQAAAAAVAAAATSKWTSSSLLHAQQQHGGSSAEALECGPSVGKGYAPSAIESKQHGSNSAFAALTAIDCIAEEGSSTATDSCAPSASSSRESSAHAGSHFLLGSSSGAANGSPTQAHAGKDGATWPHSSPLLTAGSLTKALSLSGLLRWGSNGSSITGRISTSSGPLCDEDRQDSIGSCSRSPPASPRAAAPAAAAGDSAEAAQGTSSRGSSGSMSDGGSASKQGSLQLLPMASTDSLPSSCPDTQQAAAAEGASALAATASSPLKAAPAAAVEEEGADAEPSSPTAAAAAAAAPAKRVRFALSRPEGTTPSRDYSLLYAAPELVRGERPTEKVDVFAFGMVLYELLSRRLLASSVAAVCSSSSSNSRRGSSKHRKSQGPEQQQQQLPTQPMPLKSALSNAATAESTDGSDGAGSSSDGGGGTGTAATTAAAAECGRLPEHQLLLMYAQLVAGGYRPPMLPHFPEPVVRLISSCWAAEPHERPRMAEVLQELQCWHKDRKVLGPLNSYVLALADIGYGRGSGGQQPGCSCVIS